MALMRLYKHDDRFFLFTAAAPEEEFERLETVFLSVFDSFRPAPGN